MAHAFIIGASRGLGRALVEEYLKRGWEVTATVRQRKALADLEAKSGGKLAIEAVDIVDWTGVDALRRRMKGRTFDLLFVNAGISGPNLLPIGEVEADPFTELMLVNALAPLRIVDRFADLVPKDGVIAVMSSGLGSVAENANGGWEAYRMSKAALNTGLKSIGHRRAKEGRTYFAVAPGWVRTDMGGPNATLGVEDSIPKVADAFEKRRGKRGVFFVNYENRDVAW